MKMSSGSNNNSNTTTGCGFFGLLGIAFIVLKLTGYIDWSWWLVLLPIYGPIIFAIVFVIVYLVVMHIIENSI